MNDQVHPGPLPVYHGKQRALTRLAERLWRRPARGRVPIVFALLREDDDGESGLVAWGMRLPDGSAVTVTSGPRVSFGKWSSPDRAARVHCADLAWP